jgi:hypothetical protein
MAAHSPCNTRQRHQRSADASRQASADHAQQQRGFKRQVAGKKASALNRIQTPSAIGIAIHSAR